MSMDRGMDKKKTVTVEWDIPLEHDSATKKKEIISFAVTRWI